MGLECPKIHIHVKNNTTQTECATLYSCFWLVGRHQQNVAQTVSVALITWCPKHTCTYTLCNTQYIYTVQYTVHIHCAIHSTYTLRNTQYTYTVQYTVHIHCAIQYTYTVQYSTYTLCNTQYTYTVQYTVHIHCAIHSTYTQLTSLGLTS